MSLRGLIYCFTCSKGLGVTYLKGIVANRIFLTKPILNGCLVIIVGYHTLELPSTEMESEYVKPNNITCVSAALICKNLVEGSMYLFGISAVVIDQSGYPVQLQVGFPYANLYLPLCFVFINVVVVVPRVLSYYGYNTILCTCNSSVRYPF